MIFNLIASTTGGRLGDFKAPSAAFAPSVEPTGVEAASTLEHIASMAIGGITLVAAVYFMFVLIIAGFTWLSSAGESGKLENARNMMTNGIVGLVIIIASYALIGAIGSMLGINILRFGELLLNLKAGNTVTPPAASPPAYLNPTPADCNSPGQIIGSKVCHEIPGVSGQYYLDDLSGVQITPDLCKAEGQVLGDQVCRQVPGAGGQYYLEDATPY